MNTFSNTEKFTLDQKKSWCAHKMKLRHQGNHTQKTPKKDNKMILWFEVDDTGCGMNLETV